MRKFILVGFILTMLLAACGEQQPTEASQVQQQDDVYGNNQPVHRYDYSPERDFLQQIYDARMKVVNTWTVMYSMGKPIFVCPSKGYPIPYTTQLTNPEKETDPHSTTNAVIEQAEPNGLYTGETAATWVLCIRTLPGGSSEVNPVYCESEAIAFSYPVKIEDGSIVDAGGGSSTSINMKK
jgi:hypothetical protein